MKKRTIEYNFEKRHLEQIVTIAQRQLSLIRQNTMQNKADIIASKKEMREDVTHSISNLWNMENFHDLVELSQYANPISDKITEVEMEAGKILLLEKMVDSPYFARIDLKFDGEEIFEKIYIGLSSLTDDISHDIVVYDWRAPVSSVFYRFTTGKVYYDAPAGKITGEVNLKRQYEIHGGKLEYFFDADIQIADEFLRKLLSQNASAKMKTIIETIQKDQDIIIRDMDMDLLMVQGVAGSGKTSVALHRAAYLMYEGLSKKLSFNDIVIISPNKLFEHYISNVLPDLGEKNVNSVLFEDLVETFLPNNSMQSRNQLLEYLLSSKDEKLKSVIKNSMQFKSSVQFIEILKRFIKDIPRRWINFSDVYYNGKIIASRQLLQNKIQNGKNEFSLGLRLKKLETILLETIHERKKDRLNKIKKFITDHQTHAFEAEEAARMFSIYESTALIKRIRKFTELNFFDLYKKLFSDKDYFYSLAKGLELPNNIETIIDFTSENLKADQLQYDDALALAYFHLSVNNCSDYKNIRQVVIDEVQDYDPIHFEILNQLFPKSRYTILGDVNQTIGTHKDMRLYQQIEQILAKNKSVLVTMDKSFRSTTEILNFSAKFINDDFEINSFKRKGDAPAIYTADDLSALDEMIINEIRTSKEKGYHSTALICKTEKDALLLYERLKDKIDIKLINGDGNVNLNGAFVISLTLSKGLEFDAVLICDADYHHYHTKEDQKLLYIACSRALHRLNLFYCGKISPLL